MYIYAIKKEIIYCTKKNKKNNIHVCVYLMFQVYIYVVPPLFKIPGSVTIY